MFNKNLLLPLFLLVFSGFTAVAQVQWNTIEEAEQLAIKTNKKIMVKVYTNWCGWCKEMDNSTFPDANLAKVLNDNYISVKFNAEQKSDITWGGKVYKLEKPEKGGSYHQLAATWLAGKLTYPTIVILDEKGQIIQPIPGYRKPFELEKILAYFAINGHKMMPFNEFEQQYKRK